MIFIQTLLRHAFAAPLIIAVLLTPMSAAYAQKATAPVIAIIDMQKVQREWTAVKSLSKQIGAQRNALQEKLGKKRTAIRDADQELARQRAVLSAESLALKRTELEKQVALLRREEQEANGALNQLAAAGKSQVDKALAKIALEIARERGVDLVLTKATVVIVKPELDITDEAVKRLNAAVPDVTLPALKN